MRLLVITNDFPPNIGGIENYTYSLLRRMPPEDVVVMTRWVEGGDKFDTDLEFEVRREPVGTLLPTPDLVRHAAGLIEERNIDVILFPSSPVPLGIMGPLLSARYDIPYVLSVHGGEFNLPSRLPVARQALRYVASRAALILPQSSHAEGLVSRFLDTPPPMERVTCGVDMELYGEEAPTLDLGIDGPIILTVCRLVTRKGPDTLIKALPMIHRKHPDAHVVIVGGGPDRRRLEKLASGLGLNSHVRFAGPQPWHEVPGYYNAADVFALPTRERYFGTETEGLPLVFVEAAASGLPLIGGRAGGVADAVRDGETGFIVNGSDPDDTAAAIIRLLDEPELARTLGRNAKQMVAEGFTWDQIAEHFRQALHQHAY